MYTTLDICAALVGGYLLGSVPFGLVLTRLAGLGDIRDIGSGNIGATNVLRTGNKPLALLTLLLDSGKGAMAVLLAEYFVPGMGLYAGGAAFLGHLFPLYLKFKGGKGVAIFLGTLFALCWPVGLACSLTWVGTALLFRMSSLSALTAALLSPLYGYYFFGPALAILALSMSILIFIRHKENIQRLLKGEEPRIGKK